MWRVVLDHVVLSSALLDPHGSPARLLDFALQGRVRLFATPRMLATEGRVLRADVLKKWHGMTDRDLSRFLADLPVLLCLVSGDNPGKARRSMDMELLACAAASRADFLVTSQPDALALAEQSGTQVVTSDQLVKLIGRGG